MTVAVRMTAGQRAQLARAIEHARAERARAETKARTDRARATAARRQAEVELAERLLEHVCEASLVDRAEHALGVARMVLDARGAA